MKTKPVLLIIDTPSIVYRSFYAISNSLTTSDNLPTNAVYGCVRIINKLFDLQKIDYAVCAWDSREEAIRKKEYSEYKANRQQMPEDLAVQIDYIKEFTNLFGMKNIEQIGYEADDIIFSIAEKYKKGNYEILIFSPDKDLMQLVDDNVKIIRPEKGISELKVFSKNEVKKKLGIYPYQVADFLALTGDKSDNIPGLRGVGEKTAVKLLEKYETADNIFKNIDKLDKKYIRLFKNKEDEFNLSKHLVLLKKIDIDLKPDDLIVKKNLSGIEEFYKKMQFSSFVKIEKKEKAEISKMKIEQVFTIEKMTDYINSKKNIILYVFPEDFKSLKDDLKIIIAGTDENKAFYYLNKEQKQASLFEEKKENIIEIFKNIKENINIAGYKVKNIKSLVKRFNKNINITDDIDIIEYIIEASASNKFEEIVRRRLGVVIAREQDTRIKKKSSSKYTIEEFIKDRWYCLNKLLIESKRKLNKENEKLYKKIELLFVDVLIEMENNGIKIDRKYLEDYGKEISAEIEKAENNIYAAYGKKFNINSSIQLREVLFQDLGLKPVKKTKTGYSTDNEVLEKLKDKHIIIQYILEYRELTKLYNTYIEGLLKEIEGDNKIHTKFNQTITATGRLSSSDPNLQNIPVKTEKGIKIRKAFIPEKNNLLFSADYSQIELRVLAHFSKDELLLENFAKGIDIHTATAAIVFNKSMEQVERADRRFAKIVNFGIIYGMSAYSLSKDLKISVTEAKDFIDTYFLKFNKVREFIDKTIEEAREKQYISTILNRKRQVNAINSRNKNIREYNERIAVNTIIQGSAADIIKIAMIDIYNEIKNKQDIKLLLQIHDELLFQIQKDKIDKYADLIKHKMENSIKLNTNLKVDIKIGDNWSFI